MTLFNLGDFPLHAGGRSDFKIDCDALTDVDLLALASLVPAIVPPFSSVVGVPTGGCRFASLIAPPDPDADLTLIVDDVLTTGGSMEEMRTQVDGSSHGLVIFARGPCPDWVTPIFRLTQASGIFSR